jgi:hypothetical protein
VSPDIFYPARFFFCFSRTPFFWFNAAVERFGGGIGRDAINFAQNKTYFASVKAFAK